MPGLLDLLTESWQSGEALAERLGVSRAAVSKEARRLRAEGYPAPTSSTPGAGWGGPTATWAGWGAPRTS